MTVQYSVSAPEMDRFCRFVRSPESTIVATPSQKLVLICRYVCILSHLFGTNRTVRWNGTSVLGLSVEFISDRKMTPD